MKYCHHMQKYHMLKLRTGSGLLNESSGGTYQCTKCRSQIVPAFEIQMSRCYHCEG
ncbi:hypothetical protein ISN45_At05g023710 [Arabidopsis thaliana x Arabidopsis arenosa]|uniref:Uncharacterized protein n=1 Tax=Arabidopsis thaliana x Arabidopsis arenosa TaxID=1240361 RepID=A0A8T2D2V9_9BRAS|nr:hypothetical protein ISN45_At05g023710 [Arabidopsis thaliana x Arabidopsis arenosa]